MITSFKEVNSVDIIVINGVLESNAIRAVLESFNIQVRTHYIGNVKHLISLFREENYLYKTIIICCHGDEEGLLLPELSAELEQNMPYSKRLTPLNLNEILNLDNHLVINTGCCLGGDKFAHSFLSRGAHAYIGATDYIEASEMLIFIVNLVYSHFVIRLPIKEAFDKARNSFAKDLSEIKLWGNGTID